MQKKSAQILIIIIVLLFTLIGCAPVQDPKDDAAIPSDSIVKNDDVDSNGDNEQKGNDQNTDNDKNNEAISVNDSYYFHFSFDDTMTSLKHLTDDAEYETLFDEPFFAYLKELHENYGARFSLYTYNDIICNVTDKYKDEFRANWTWLKLGLHSTSHHERFNNATYEQGRDAWNYFVKHAVRVTGTSLSIDRMPRLHYWQGTEEAMKGMRDADCGALGFLSSDHAWRSYYLTQPQHTYVYNHDHLNDYKNGLTFVATDMRIDWFIPGYKFTNTYKRPTEDTIYKELERRFTSVDFASTLSSYIVFGHESNYYDGNQVSDAAKVWFSDICKFAFDNGITFDYPQNRSYLPTQADIFPQ